MEGREPLRRPPGTEVRGAVVYLGAMGAAVRARARVRGARGARGRLGGAGRVPAALHRRHVRAGARERRRRRPPGLRLARRRLHRPAPGVSGDGPGDRPPGQDLRARRAGLHLAAGPAALVARPVLRYVSHVRRRLPRPG